MYRYNLFTTYVIGIIIITNLAQSSNYYIKDGEVPSYLYQKFNNITEDIFPSSISIRVAFSAVKGTLLYSIDKNMNQLIVTMRDDVHIDTRYGLQVELNKQFILVSLSKLCGQKGFLFDERLTMTLQIKITIDDITLICDPENSEIFMNERRTNLHDNYPIPYTPANTKALSMNEAHLWIVNHPIYGEIYPNRDQMYGCIFYVIYNGQPITFTNMSSNIGDTCCISCRNNMCNGGECFVLYSEEPICNCTNAFRNGRLCSDKMIPMNFRTTSQIFNFKMFKVSWKSMSNSILELINKDIRILIGRNDSNLFFEYNFMNSSKKTVQVTLSDEYVPNNESICIIYFHEHMINIVTYVNNKSSTIWLPSVVDIRQEQIDTMVFRSEEGVMDFVFKYIPETLWISLDFRKTIEFEKEPKIVPSKMIAIVIASILSIVGIIFGTLFILLTKCIINRRIRRARLELEAEKLNKETRIKELEEEKANMKTKLKKIKEDLRKVKGITLENEKVTQEILDYIDKMKDIPGEIFVVVYGFDGLSKSRETLILSPYFYSHLSGYTVRLRVYPGGRGNGRGTHLSLYPQICKGEYDDDLSWPCKYIFSLSMVDQLRIGVTHNTRTISHDITEDNGKHCYYEPINRDNRGHGYSQYMSHSDLRSTEGVLVNDRIIIKCTVTPPSQ